MAWTSETKNFGPREMGMIGALDVTVLSHAIMQSDSLVALRILAELFLHGDTLRLLTLLQNPEIHAHWQEYTWDDEVSQADYQYATHLLNLISQQAE